MTVSPLVSEMADAFVEHVDRLLRIGMLNPEDVTAASFLLPSTFLPAFTQDRFTGHDRGLVSEAIKVAQRRLIARAAASTPKALATRAREVAAAARDVPLPAHARELVAELVSTIDQLAALVDPPGSPEG